MQIKLTIQKIADKIYAVIVPNSYDRNLLFLRAQEYYESPSAKFRNKAFCFFDFMKWYSAQSKRSGAFTYASDWAGFNLPFDIAKECYEKLNYKYQTPYDEIFDCKILDQINESGSYIIGTDTTYGCVFEHELAHALFYTNAEYKQEMLALVNNLPKKLKYYMGKQLKFMGYTPKVYDDEIHAYLSTHRPSDDFFDEVSLDMMKVYSKPFKKVFKKYTKKKSI